MGMTYKAVHVRIARVTWQMIFGQLHKETSRRENGFVLDGLPAW